MARGRWSPISRISCLARNTEFAGGTDGPVVDFFLSLVFSMISPKIKAGCGVFAVFGLGFVIGGFSLLFIIVKVVPLAEGWKTEQSKEFVAEHFANRLKLTDAQREEFRPIVYEALERRWALRREYLLKDLVMMEEEFLPKIDSLLDESQRQEARKILERWRRDHRGKLEAP